MVSPQSDAADVGNGRRAALARFLVAESGARVCEIDALVPLAGGAIQENWGLDTRFSGGSLDGPQRLVLRAAGNTGVPSSLERLHEFAVLKAAFAAGVTVPEPLYASADPSIFGKPFFVMRRANGTAAAHHITRNPALDPVLPQIGEQLGRELARIHAIRPPRPDLDFLSPYEKSDPACQIAGFRDYLDAHPSPRPVLEWGLRWLETHVPAPAEPVLCHHDFRTGNYLLDGARLTGILDWEFAGWGDPHEDLGWFCSKGWRFARLDREAGGIADREPFYRGYEAESGRRIDPVRVHFWEVIASVRWAIIALQQSDRHILGGERSLDLALTGRRASECELAILMLLDPAYQSSVIAAPSCSRVRKEQRPEAAASPVSISPINDLPRGPALLACARELLVSDLLPLLPAGRRLDARLIANCMAIAQREAEQMWSTAEPAVLELATLYGDPDPPYAAVLARFARDMRIGGFENSPERAGCARDILWRLTIAKLRMANPRFLAANGFS
ncbi:MAG: phosphotransferase family protein [Alphaproteobacteria bacterium]|nr:phosphotransferase family protein [Alphaproteobacteria bacterium]